MSLDLATRYLEQLLPAPGGRPYKRFKLHEPAEIIPGLLYRFSIFGGTESREVSVSVFLGVGGLGGALWEQEMRTLERLSGLNHSALPELLDGGHLEGIDGSVGAAYVRTIRRGIPASDESFSRRATAERDNVLPHLWLLADALSLLHESNISHRGLWPGALFVETEEEEEPPEREIKAVQLGRFEMSALLANLFRSREGEATYQQLRETYLTEDPRSLLYTPPERLDFVFDRPDGQLGGPPGDVFSLGMIAAEWLVTGPPTGSLPTTYDGIRGYQEEAARRVRNARDLPGQLIELIDGMLRRVAGERPTAFDAARGLALGYADAQQLLAGDVPELPYLVVYMADKSDMFLRNRWNLIEDSALTDEGREQLATLIEDDMRGAEILDSPSGALGFASDETAALRRARTVIIGEQVTWFCDEFWTQKYGGGTKTYPEMLVIKYVRLTSEIQPALGRLRTMGLVRRLPMVEAEPAPRGNPDVAEVLCEGRPLWSSLVRPAESSRSHSSKEREYLDSLEWYLQYQRAMLDARTYAYEVDLSESSGERVHLRWNENADRTRRLGQDNLLSHTAILDTRRPDMAVFVGNVDEELDTGRVQLTPEASPDWGAAEQYDVVDVIEPNIVVVSTRGKRRPPSTGWLRLGSDAGTQPQITRQQEALVELGSTRVLLQRLINPRVQRRSGARWVDAGGELLGEGREAVQEILQHDGIFALQGPPGTGKTEVTSQAIADYLAAEPGARVLVSAQSHDALENLAVRITRKLGITTPAGSNKATRLDRLALRVRPSSRNRDPNPELDDLEPKKLAAAVTDHSVRRSQQWLASRRAELPSMIPVVQRWIAHAPDAQLELTRRVRTAANVVFATTGAATRRNLFVDATNEPFDWVVVEEAGRAWPTELALPLVRGVRWTLVGDHAQIGAYSRADVERFLESLGGYESEEIKAMYDARARHSANFGTFARFFEEGGRRPTKVLSQQYRMDAAISSLVGDVFYSASGGLEAMREPAPHPLVEPELLRDRRLLWIDTGIAERSVGFWGNDHEAALCARLVRSMRPEPGRPSGASLAVITPYREQVRLLRGQLSEHNDRIHTVDGFQGREADIVVASLVRDRVRPIGTPSSAVGHVADPRRINVLLSRARELVVVVGRFDVYAHSAGPEWSAITERFLVANAVVRAEGRLA